MHSTNNIFFDNSGTLRSGWRVAVFIFTFGFVALTLGTIVRLVLAALQIDAPPGSNRYLVINAVFSLIPAILVGWTCGTFLERLPFSALGASFTNGWLKHLMLGLAVGAATMAAAVLIAVIGGGLAFDPHDVLEWNLVRSLAVAFVVFALAAAFEEALFRGYVLQTLARSELTWLAILLTSLFFAAVHLGNPDATMLSTFNTALGGVWFSIAYLKTRDLWFVWGMHLMWNWAQGSIFGIEVSGLTSVSTTPLMREIDTGPTWLTGQTYGIEGGIACTAAIIVSIIAIQFLPIFTTETQRTQS